MNILDRVAFVLHPRAAGACPWLHCQAIDSVACDLVKMGQEIACHPLVVPGQLSALGEAILTMAEIHNGIGEMLQDVAHGIRREAMAKQAVSSQQPELTEPARPNLVLLQGGKSDGEERDSLDAFIDGLPLA